MDESENDNTKGSFTFVLIPTGNDPFEEVTKPKAGINHDALLKYARTYFGLSDDTVCVCMRMCVGLRLRCMDVQGSMQRANAQDTW